MTLKSIYGIFGNMLSYCVYVLFSQKDGLLYIGYSGNLERRLTEHIQGKCRSTSYRRPLELIFCEYYLFKKDALKREAYFKTNPGKKALKLMLRTTLLSLGYSATQAVSVMNE